MENTKVQDYIESNQQQWDEEYKSNVWDYLSDITEYARYSVVCGYIRKFIAEEGILDMGCGTGILYDMLLDSEKEVYTGVDLSQEAIKMASAKSTKNIFHCGDINQYVPEKQYDVIVFNESLHYVPNTPSKLLEYSKFLTPNGVIVSSLYSHKNTQDLAYTIIENKIEEMEQCGQFDVVDKVSVFNHNAGLKWYIHLLKKKNV
ncbi:class I SAM-dependent methyltransferase [Paenibacillus apiarius]|uniref:Class I SAM-dependent methyltransferase n=1 Tax=Paenibacillus apiarius TaxID=46240 RepID=A0ABT4DZ76_9BACL|nr:class I SAM-dependent methyltransferase [Paenibacillus apiarius]MCY9513258.1 class I SAM-dependent methyltransferase [Paenibacillus apiarius]MCY9521383.1 class I SAM-dependent methyltransferase [Paenibacillus apiarius]MCY9554471.1 class I SAM-dependent methyltransferase [Paenibacillus apiarius]MCY9560674.1 class I SAM-dependent methyltransferase [Paenibacillus apiarius]MCY9685075.1 class I SAM-dependent methyltransferase [Paenibacillus apiarius]